MAHVDTTTIVRASVWIRPTGPALDALVRAIRIAHRRAGGPAVQPHVSLLGGVERSQAAAELGLEKLAARVEPFEIRLGDVDWRDEFYRCLFFAVEPSPALVRAHEAAREAFGMMPPDPFEPHVSLAYGDLDLSLKEAIADELQGGRQIAFQATMVALVNASESVPIPEWRSLSERRLGKA